MSELNKTIWTIGHSTRTITEFLEILNEFKIETIADIRRYPGSKRYPHFNKEELNRSLKENGITYRHLEELGGRRRPRPDSHNTNWKNASFRGYADYMETQEFTDAVKGLEAIAKLNRTAYMCSEAVWWQCHRRLVSDYLKSKGWEVIHIMNKNIANPHIYSPPFIARRLF